MASSNAQQTSLFRADNHQIFYLTTVLSFIFHLVILVAVIFAAEFTLTPEYEPVKPIINISMVTLPVQEPPPPVEAPKLPEKTPPEEIVEEPVVPLIIKPPVEHPKPPSIKHKAAFKRLTKKKKRVVQKPNTKALLKTTPAKTEIASLQDVMEDLRKQVRNEEQNMHPAADDQARPNRHVRDAINMYRLDIAYQIEKKWAFSDQVAGEHEELEALVVIRVVPDGRVNKIWFEKKSGNNYMDESAMRAILKISPFPPHPKIISQAFVDVALKFTPYGLHQ